MIQNFSRTSFLNHPFAMLRFMLGNKNMLHDAMLLRAAKILMKDRYNKNEAKEYIRELNDGNFIPMNRIDGVELPGNRPDHLFGKFLYFIIRCAKPEVMVETGVAHGVSSWTILNAIHRNGKGKLYSIDLPNLDLKSYNPENLSQQSGWVVPNILRDHWELKLGSSHDLLPLLAQRLGKIDVFFHDSDHSYENMMFEFNTVFPFLSANGLLISDDVHKNESFTHFTSSKNLAGFQFPSKGGAALL